MSNYTKDNIAIGIIAEARSRNLDDLAAVCGLSCSLVEADLQMYANANDPETLRFPYDKLSTDKNSSGPFQQRPPWWGTPADRMDVRRSAGMFFGSLVKQRNPEYHQDPGIAIANVQNCRKDLRWKYGARMDDAWAVFNRLKNSDAAPPVGETPAAAPISGVQKPAFTELDFMTGGGRSTRSRPAINAFIHTEEGDSSAEQLARYCDGSHDVSYHYTIRDGIVCDVVDTDYYSWAVLNANVFSINYCFAGSRAAWSREQWMARQRDIDIVAYLIVQDCLKYPSMNTLVIPPPYNYQGPGISDHKYVTQALHIGNHVDVGGGFPWDYFESRILYYNGFQTAGDELMTKEEHDALFKVLGYLENPVPSGSPYTPAGGAMIPTKDLIRYTDAATHAMAVEQGAIVFGDPANVAQIRDAAQRGVIRAQLAWNKIPEEFKRTTAVS